MGSDIQSQTGQSWTVPPCNLLCAHHCAGPAAAEETERLIRLRGDIDAQNRALSLSSMLVLALLAIEGLFSFIGKPLVLQNMEILWAIVCGSWFGTAGSKLAEMIVRKRFGE